MFLLLSTMLDDKEQISLFESIYHDYGKLIKYIGLQITRNETAAEDVVQECMLQIARYIKRFDGLDEAPLRALVAVFAKNTALHVLRSERRNSAVPLEDVTPASPSEQNATSLRFAIDGLPAEQRDCLLLHYYYGFSAAEIATVKPYGISQVYKLITAAKRQLRQFLREGEEI